MKIKYALPSTDEAESTEPNGDEELKPPPPFASVLSVAWVEQYDSVIAKLRVTVDQMIGSGQVIPEDEAAGRLPVPAVFSGKAPRALPDGTFLDAISWAVIERFVFPPHELSPKSAARLVLLAKFGPLHNGTLMGGPARSAAVPEHFAYRVPKSAAAPLSSTKLLMEQSVAGAPVIAHPMKIKELDSVECHVEKTSNPSLLLMCMAVEREDMILSLSKSAAMSACEQAEILAQVSFEVRNIYNPSREACHTMLAGLPTDTRGEYSFADLQSAVLEAHTSRVARTQKLYPHLFEKRTFPRPTGNRVPAELAYAAMQEREGEEALLSLYTSQIAESSEFKDPGLRQNVMLVRGEESKYRIEGQETRPRWDSQCAVRQRDQTYVRPSKTIL
eukprot:TRINITY_DN5490_c0_g1_i7.p1 TRINITY_DN5490_c0_g1~~TRINITY_DN5490_c0_g1_i7.p1  ORF type:complete len:388 (-),score=110.58 TRINITY_DN5490_c0_g1_i7:36-1199(-)